MTAEKMTSKEYDFWKAAIQTANDIRDPDECKKALRGIHLQLATQFGYSEEVRYLLKRFRYDI